MRVRPGIFRLALATVVVINHSTPLRLGTWAVGLFFCLSGFWIAEMWGRKYSRLDRPYVEFIVSRWWRLAPVLLVSTTLATICIRCRWMTGTTLPMHRAVWWATQLTIAASGSFGRVLPPAWSLDVEMQFYLVAPLLVVVASRLPMVAVGGIVALSLCWCGRETALGHAGEAPRLDLWIGVFLMGIATSVFNWRPSRTWALGSAAATSALLLTAIALPQTRQWLVYKGSSHRPIAGWAEGTLTVASIVLAVPFAMATTRNPTSVWDRFFSDLSYPLYLAHWMPRQWFYDRLAGHPRPATAAILLAMNIVIAFAIAVVILVLVDRPVQGLRPRWIRSHAKTLASCSPTSPPDSADA